jgi:catechol 2,3-dioxygenase-like lactoylglutathione lyase family enzyme
MDLDHIVLAVANLEQSVPFYDELFLQLGFQKARAHVYVNGQGIGIDVQQAKEPTYGYRRGGVGLNHLAVRATSRAEVDAVTAAMGRAGFEVPEAQTIGDAYAVFMKDRDGLRVEITFEP